MDRGGSWVVPLTSTAWLAVDPKSAAWIQHLSAIDSVHPRRHLNEASGKRARASLPQHGAVDLRGEHARRALSAVRLQPLYSGDPVVPRVSLHASSVCPTP